MRVLIVEDDTDTREMIDGALTRAHQNVECAATGDEGLWLATEIDFDLVLLDWSLPGTDGLEVCRLLRERERWMPILMLTGNAAVHQRVIGLNAGADDYLTKPFDLGELIARVHALGRRTPAARPTVLRAGELSMEVQSRQVRRGDTAILLRPREFSLLELLMNRAGEVLDRAEILDRVWDAHFEGMSNTVDVHVKTLRAKIDRPFGTDSIETVPRIGYRLRTE